MLVERRVHPRRTPRRGFTLVEILVVVAIITILVALLVPAVFFAVKVAKTATISLEVANLAKALERYKLDNGEYPPDFAASEEFGPYNEQDSSNWPARAQAARIAIDTHLQGVRRRRNNDAQTGDFPLMQNGAVNNAVLATLSPANALSFWLSGFSADPTYPVSGAGERSAVFEFDEKRLVLPKVVEQSNRPCRRQANGSTAEDRFFGRSYYPASDPQKKPYLYYNSASYAIENRGEFILDGRSVNCNWACLWAKNNNGAPPVRDAAVKTSNALPEFAHPQKFQIVSAGLDGDYGPLSGNQWDQIGNYPEVPSGLNVAKAIKDNVTSATDGTVESRIAD